MEKDLQKGKCECLVQYERASTDRKGEHQGFTLFSETIGKIIHEF